MRREKRLPLPPEGPVLVSGVVPWLSRQREVPLGKVLLVSLLDFSSMEFRQAELTVTDDTAESSEVQLYKVLIRTPGGDATEWLDANGHVTRQSIQSLQVDLLLMATQEEIGEARAALSAPVAKIPMEALPESLLERISEYLPET
jgi:hypothetical protein